MIWRSSTRFTLVFKMFKNFLFSLFVSGWRKQIRQKSNLYGRSIAARQVARSVVVNEQKRTNGTSRTADNRLSSIPSEEVSATVTGENDTKPDNETTTRGEAPLSRRTALLSRRRDRRWTRVTLSITSQLSVVTAAAVAVRRRRGPRASRLRFVCSLPPTTSLTGR